MWDPRTTSLVNMKRCVRYDCCWRGEENSRRFVLPWAAIGNREDLVAAVEVIQKLPYGDDSLFSVRTAIMSVVTRYIRETLS